MYFFGVNSIGFVVFSQGSQGPFRAFAVLVFLAIFNEFLGVLIDAEVCQVDESFADIFSLGIILISRKSGQAFFEHVDAKRVIASYKDVDSKIILEAINQMRIAYILRNQYVLLILHV